MITVTAKLRCNRHPKYTGKLAPKVACDACKQMYFWRTAAIAAETRKAARYADRSVLSAEFEVR